MAGTRKSPRPAGYSGTPLVQKLGFKPGARFAVTGAPRGYLGLLGPLPAGSKRLSCTADGLDLIHVFTSEAADLQRRLVAYLPQLADDGALWISWPKKASGVPTDVTEDVVRKLALPLGLVDVKVCAVDETWSGLKLVIRRQNRGARADARAR